MPQVLDVLHRIVESWDRIPIRAVQDGKWQSLFLSEIKDQNQIARAIVRFLEPFLEPPKIERIQFTIGERKTPLLNPAIITAPIKHDITLDLNFECDACGHKDEVHLGFDKEMLKRMLEDREAK